MAQLRLANVALRSAVLEGPAYEDESYPRRRIADSFATGEPVRKASSRGLAASQGATAWATRISGMPTATSTETHTADFSKSFFATSVILPRQGTRRDDGMHTQPSEPASLNRRRNSSVVGRLGELIVAPRRGDVRSTP